MKKTHKDNGSTQNGVEDNPKTLNRYMFRKSYRTKRIRFLDSIDFRIEDWAKETNTSVGYIEERYSTFLQHHFGIDMGIENSPYIESVWDEFVEYENGGKPFDAENSFKEKLYPKHSITEDYQFRVSFQKDPKDLFLNSSEDTKDDEIPFHRFS